MISLLSFIYYDLLCIWGGSFVDVLEVLMVGGMTLCAIADVGTGLASSLPFLIVARLLLGAGLSSSDAGSSAWVADPTVPWQLT